MLRPLSLLAAAKVYSGRQRLLLPSTPVSHVFTHFERSVLLDLDALDAVLLGEARSTKCFGWTIEHIVVCGWRQARRRHRRDRRRCHYLWLLEARRRPLRDLRRSASLFFFLLPPSTEAPPIFASSFPDPGPSGLGKQGSSSVRQSMGPSSGSSPLEGASRPRSLAGVGGSACGPSRGIVPGTSTVEKSRRPSTVSKPRTPAWAAGESTRPCP